MIIDPLKEDFLAVVTSWSSSGPRGGIVGSAIPVFCVTKNVLVEEPRETFPDPGYVFLVNRGGVQEWDWVLLNPQSNDKYVPGKSRYLSFEVPTIVETASEDARVASIISLNSFDPTAATGLIRLPAQNVLPVFFVHQGRNLFGPLRRVAVNRRPGSESIESIQWAPLGDDRSIFEFPDDDLPRYGLTRMTFSHPNPDNEMVVRAPIQVLYGAVTTAKSDRVHDRMTPADLASWYLKWREMSNVPDPILKALRNAPEYLDEMTPDIIRSRCRRLSMIFNQLDVLQLERAHIAQRYLDTEEGRKLLRTLIDREVEKKARQIDTEVGQLKKELSKEKYRLEKEVDTVRAETARRKQQLQHETNDLERQRQEATKALDEIRSQISNGIQTLAVKLREELPTFAALTMSLGGSQRGPVAASNGHTEPVNGGSESQPAWNVVGLPEPTKTLDAVADEKAFVEQLSTDLASEGLYFTREFVTNLYIAMKASSFNLIMGPPGYGKSSVVAGLARSLGHGNALLEVAVRRTWSDDRYLLGFFDTFHGRYDPGPTGLATRLLQAQNDWHKDKTGLYFILMDEFNLAAPEYYFSQLLQLMSRPAGPDRVLRLFDASSVRQSSKGAADRIELNANVNFWGTINYDETTERLSPRLLDRSGMIFLGVGDVVPLSAGTNVGSSTSGSSKGIAARQLVERFIRPSTGMPEESWTLLEPFLSMIAKPSDAWGEGATLSPRVLEAVKRYLANAKDLLPAERSVDYVIEQRVLPVLRGRGPKFTERMKVLADMLSEKGLNRSALHVKDALSIAESNFGDVDFLAY